jgi:CRISPR/Cas system-associated exonuclease Cas4 (RecB family)
MPTQHSKIGGSVVHRIIACPWSLANIHRAVPQGSSEAANEGTALHEILELYYTDRIDSLDEMLGAKMHGIEITEERLELAKDAGRALDAYIDKLEEELGDRASVRFESRVSFGDRIPGAFGTCDVLLRCGPVFAVLDYKFGRVDVPVEENAQLMFYARAAQLTFPGYEDATSIELNIIQPRADKIHKRFVTTPEALKKFEAQLIAVIKESEGDSPSCVTGSHCRYCPLEPVCPAKQGIAAEALDQSIEDLDLEQLIYWMSKKEEIESFLGSVREAVHSLLEAGRRVPGFKLVARRATRKWKNEKDVLAWCKQKGLEWEQYTDTKLLSPAQLEKLIEDLPEDLIVKKSAGTTVAPDDDRRVDLNQNNYSALKRFQS